MLIPTPYLLYLCDATEPLSVKTARGIAVWRPEFAIGQNRVSSDVVDLGLPDLSFAAAVEAGAKTLVLGVANAGGFMPDHMLADILAALEAGLDIASGLHERLADNPRIWEAAERYGRQLFDVRKPAAKLPIGTGVRRRGRRLLTVGTDCSVGKMYTALSIERELRRRGKHADFRATGQTGILIAGSGVPVDAVPGDFLSGVIEALSPDRDDGGWDLIEGQGSLFHPSYAGVSLGLLHGAQPDAIVLCHQSGRDHMRHLPGQPMPDLRLCIERNLEAARLTSPDVRVVGISLNTAFLPEADRWKACKDVEDRLGLPCTDPVAFGIEPVVDRLLQCFAG